MALVLLNSTCRARPHDLQSEWKSKEGGDSPGLGSSKEVKTNECMSMSRGWTGNPRRSMIRSVSLEEVDLSSLTRLRVFTLAFPKSALWSL